MGGRGGQFGNFSIRKFPAVRSRATSSSLRTDRDGSLMSHRHLILFILLVMLMVMLVIVMMMVTMLAMPIADVKDKKVVAQRKA